MRTDLAYAYIFSKTDVACVSIIMDRHGLRRQCSRTDLAYVHFFKDRHRLRLH